jgi:hypothetical protein
MRITSNAGRLKAYKVVAFLLTTVTYLLAALLALTVSSMNPAGNVALSPILLAIGILEVLLVLAFLGCRQALWAGLLIQSACLLVAVGSVGRVTLGRGLAFALIVTILTHNWLASMEGDNDWK